MVVATLIVLSGIIVFVHVVVVGLVPDLHDDGR
jgi:hypothetical protein